MIFDNTGKKSWNELDDNTKGLLMLAYYEGKTIQEWWEDEDEGGYDWHDVEYDDCYPPKWPHGIWRIKPEPVKEVHWCNEYKNGPFGWYASREVADTTAGENRIAVIRREIVNGVISYYTEDV